MCSLEEAFQSFSEEAALVPSSRSSDPEKKRKKRRPALPPPEPVVIEPDRPAHRRLPAAELLGGGPEAFTESSSVSQMLNAFESESYFPHPSSDVKESNVYKLEPDWTKAFNDSSTPDWIKTRMPSREAEVPLTPAPWLDGGATLWQNVSEGVARQVDLRGAEQAANRRLDDMQRKLDSMFKKLQDNEVTKNESNHLEIILFVLGGIFLVFLLDLLVKQGSQAMMMIAAAGGAQMLQGGGWRYM